MHIMHNHCIVCIINAPHTLSRIFLRFFKNLLDIPGDQDFSEDTYRALTAVDSALMVVDSGKGSNRRRRSS